TVSIAACCGRLALLFQLLREEGEERRLLGLYQRQWRSRYSRRRPGAAAALSCLQGQNGLPVQTCSNSWARRTRARYLRPWLRRGDLRIAVAPALRWLRHV